VTLSFSAVYEILEWQVVARVAPAAGLAFLGTQGDVGDAQKDMLLAGLGATLAMSITASLNWHSSHNFLRGLKKSFGISADDESLGEARLGK
jgi:putative membrane protein